MHFYLSWFTPKVAKIRMLVLQLKGSSMAKFINCSPSLYHPAWVNNLISFSDWNEYLLHNFLNFLKHSIQMAALQIHRGLNKEEKSYQYFQLGCGQSSPNTCHKELQQQPPRSCTCLWKDECHSLQHLTGWAPLHPSYFTCVLEMQDSSTLAMH